MSGKRLAEGDDRALRERHPVRAGLRRHGVVRPPPALRDLVRASDFRFTDGNEVELYLDGRAGLEAMLAAIDAARRRVHLETYILHGDATGRRFVALLAERAAAGVEVRLLYDAVGSRGLSPTALAPLRDAGADVVAFNPLRRFYPRWAPRRRDHRKILVVDGEVAFTGGLNIGDEYFHRDGAASPGVPAPPLGSWRDAHVRVRGPAVQALEAVFLESWFRADGPGGPWATGPAPEPAPVGERIAVLPDGPTYRRRRVRDLLIDGLIHARRSAQFASPYFIPGPRVLDALEAAASRGVDVTLVTAGRTDHPFVRWAAHGGLPRLLARDVRVFEYEESMLHSKVAVFDESWAMLGTSNLDRQSLHYSYEVNLVIEGGGLPARLAEMLRRDALASREVTSASLGRESLFARARDRLAALVMSRL